MTDSAGIIFLFALLDGLTGLAIGLPAWRTYRQRMAIDERAARYRAWRGRADRPGTTPSGGMTSAERIRVVIGVALGVSAVALLAVGMTIG